MPVQPPRRPSRPSCAARILGLLHGLPIGVKDLQDTAGMRTTYGSLLYKDHVPDADNSAVARVRGEGGIILAKTNTPEFGAGANTVNRVYGATGNPFDPVKTCAGSSGGSAVALGAGAGAAGDRLRLRRQPAHAGGLLRRRRASGRRLVWCRARRGPRCSCRSRFPVPWAAPSRMRTCC